MRWRNSADPHPEMGEGVYIPSPRNGGVYVPSPRRGRGLGRGIEEVAVLTPGKPLSPPGERARERGQNVITMITLFAPKTIPIRN